MEEKVTSETVNMMVVYVGKEKINFIIKNKDGKDALLQIGDSNPIKASIVYKALKEFEDKHPLAFD